MAQVAIQPSYGNAEARAHWDRTLKVPVRFADEAHREALSDEQLAALTAFHPDGFARFWGATANQDKKMDTLQPGDVCQAATPAACSLHALSALLAPPSAAQRTRQDIGRLVSRAHCAMRVWRGSREKR